MEREKLIALVEGVKNGEETALAEIYTAFHDDLYYYIYKTMGDPELSADLTQDTFLEIMQSIHTLQEPAAFVTWSRQLAYRRCTAYFKKRHDFLADEDEDGYSVFDTIEEDRTEFIPDAALDKEDLRQTIQGIINELPEEQRSAIMMRYFDELPLAEVAKIQGVSEGTVKSRLNYGRKSIKQAVEDYEKKSGVKLRCVGIVPLLLWLLREYRRENGLSLTTGAAKTAAAGTAVAGTAAAGAVTSAAGAAIGAKVAAIVAAASIAVTGVGLGIAKLVDRNEEEPTVTVCAHVWEDTGSGICALCSERCGHKHLSREETSVAEGIMLTAQNCTDCLWHKEEYSLVHTDKPIHVQLPLDFIPEHITEKSHQYMMDLLKDHQDITADSNITAEVAGTLYFYNDTWVDKGNNNRLLIIYHMEDGIVPGGWYTYLGPNGNMAVQSFENEDGTRYFSTVSSGDYNDYMSYLWLECHKEAYSFWIDTAYPTTFVYEGKRYTGHTNMDEVLESLKQNCFADFDLTFDHMIATGEIEKLVTEY